MGATAGTTFTAKAQQVGDGSSRCWLGGYAQRARPVHRHEFMSNGVIHVVDRVLLPA